MMDNLEDDMISATQKTYFEIGLSGIGFTIVCGNVFVLVTMYRYADYTDIVIYSLRIVLILTNQSAPLTPIRALQLNSSSTLIGRCSFAW